VPCPSREIFFLKITLGKRRRVSAGDSKGDFKKGPFILIYNQLVASSKEAKSKVLQLVR
jgi:hypothetical protein